MNTVVHRFAHARLREVNDKIQKLNDKGEHWAIRHKQAWHDGNTFECAIRYMILGWTVYADMHYKRYESLIGDDGVLGPAWAEQGKSIIDLLNGETGRFDCGTLDGLIRTVAKDNGIDSLGD